MRYILSLLLLSLISASLYSQHNKSDVIYLKDKSIYRGKIISQNEDHILIETFGGNTINISKTEIDKTTKEKYTPYHTLKERGYYNYTSMGALIGSQSDEKTTNFSILMEHNYKLNNYFAVGATTGIEWYNVSVMPLAINTKLLVPATHQMGFYIGGTGGYAIPLEELIMDQYEIIETSGGWMGGVDFGILFPSIGNVNIFLAMGYRYQELSFVREDWWVDEIEQLTKYNRFNLKIGVCLH